MAGILPQRNRDDKLAGVGQRNHEGMEDTKDSQDRSDLRGARGMARMDRLPTACLVLQREEEHAIRSVVASGHRLCN